MAVVRATRKICTDRYGSFVRSNRNARSRTIASHMTTKRSRTRQKTRRAAAKRKAGGADLRKLKGEVSRDRILDSALALFSARGYAATGVYDIARAAKIEKTALYWHFGSKEGLLAAVLDRMDAEFVESSSKRVAEQGGDDSNQRLDLFVKGLKGLAAKRGHMIRMLLSISIERSHLSEDTRDTIQRIFDRTRDALALGFEEALGVKVPEIDLISRLCLAYLHEASVRAQIDPRGVEHDRFFAHLRRLIVLDVNHQLDVHRVEIDPGRRFAL